ncbi:hypothetical protein BJY16_006361 [Actinoplanes octamycinicus]|uniref:Uncharacterized protein n=1 Tax=Actinoplanes octamycinicus TaxID=135948 RepID=A0A7W7H2W3_9ACTN|nr:hypothetical protein [Actinoplanes octamycinicus]MBB4742902.1 hypothetical protein [Actinoplanes octamycinicus]
MVVVLAVLLFLLFLLMLVGLATWPAFQAGTKHDNKRTAGVDAHGARAAPATFEGALTVQLLRGEISADQYRCALERLAARDDRDHPLSVPERGDPGATA